MNDPLQALEGARQNRILGGEILLRGEVDPDVGGHREPAIVLALLALVVPGGDVDGPPDRREQDGERVDGEREATNYFFSLGDAENVLELTYNHDGRSYDLGTGYGHIAIAVDDLDGTLDALKDGHGIEPERPPYQSQRGMSAFA